MLAVVIQPYSYKRMHELRDLKSISILRFTHRGLLDEDFAFDVKAEGGITEIDDLNELYDSLVKSIEKGDVITYNSRLLITTINILASELGREVPADMSSNIVDLMYKFSRLHNNGRWAKLEAALTYYDHKMSVDTEDPHDMCAKTIMLYRLMQENDEL